MKNYFIPGDDAGKDQWLSNFVTKLPTYAAKYGISAAEITDIQSSYTCWHYWLDYKNKFQEYTKKLTEYKNQLRSGIPAGTLPAIQPIVPVVGVAPTTVAPDIFGRAASLANRVKSFTSYTEADGRDLGIVGQHSLQDTLAIKPTISLRLQAGHPELVWNKQNMGGIEIYVCRDGSTTFTFLAFDSHPNYTDNSPLPPAGQSQVWKYKAMYRYHDELVGLMSDEVSISVAGLL